MHDEAQMRHDHLASSIEILLVAEASGEPLLVLFAQYGDRADGVDIGVKTAYRTGEYKIVVCCSNCFCHLEPPLGRQF